MTKHTSHSHVNERGLLVECYHRCRHWFSPAFLTGWIVVQTIGWPLEHWIWLNVPILKVVGQWIMGEG